MLRISVFIVLLLFSLVSCVTDYFSYSRAQFGAYVDEFTYQCLQHNFPSKTCSKSTYTKIFLVSNPRVSASSEIVAAYCLPSSNTIYLNDRDWDSTRPYSFSNEQLLFHELGHCILGRDHNNQLNLTTGQSVSIMYFRMGLLESYYLANRESYLNELFNIKLLHEAY